MQMREIDNERDRFGSFRSLILRVAIAEFLQHILYVSGWGLVN